MFDSTSGSENIAWYRGGTAIGNVNVDVDLNMFQLQLMVLEVVSRNVIVNCGQDSTFRGNESGSNKDANDIGLFSII